MKQVVCPSCKGQPRTRPVSELGYYNLTCARCLGRGTVDDEEEANMLTYNEYQEAVEGADQRKSVVENRKKQDELFEWVVKRYDEDLRKNAKNLGSVKSSSYNVDVMVQYDYGSPVSDQDLIPVVRRLVDSLCSRGFCAKICPASDLSFYITFPQAPQAQDTMDSPDYTKENKASFFARLEGQVLPSQLVKIKTAYMIAKHAHRAQERMELGRDGRKLRYFEHVRRVALIVLDNVHPLYPSCRWEDVCAALMHDTIEDTVDVTAEILEELFGPEVCKLVMVLTKWPGKKDSYLRQIESAGERGVYLKMCDRLDNLRSLRGEEIGNEFREKQKVETREIWMPGPFKIFRHTPMWDEMAELCGYEGE